MSETLVFLFVVHFEQTNAFLKKTHENISQKSTNTESNEPQYLRSNMYHVRFRCLFISRD